MANKVDWTGKRVGNLSVIREESSCRWKVRCDCGNEKVIASGDLARGQKNGFAVCKTWCHYAPKRYSRVKHGHYKSPEYGVWHRMKDRCYIKSNPSYLRYGGRGITVCKRWKDDFRTFLEDMGKMPEPGMSVDRIDNDKGYSPENCRWATPKEQANNRNSNVLIDTPWGRMTVSQAAEKSGIQYAVLLNRTKSGTGKDLFRKVRFQNETHNTKWGLLTTKEACAKAGISPKLAWSRMARGISNPDEIFTTDDLRINKR